jgi:hypothetical protein
MLPYLLFYPAFDHSKTNLRMDEPKVAHPAAQNRIDFRNHRLHGPTDMLSEDLPELRIAATCTEFKKEEIGTLSPNESLARADR